jgi:hypothetical protein
VPLLLAAQLDRRTRALLASQDFDRLEIVAALGEPRVRLATRPEPALRAPDPTPLRQRVCSTGECARVSSRFCPPRFTAFLGRAERDRRAPVA